MIETIKWIASGAGMIAALMIAWDHGRRTTGWGFVVFIVASCAWITTGIAEGEAPLAIQNAVLLGINIFGAYRYLVRKKGTE